MLTEDLPTVQSFFDLFDLFDLLKPARSVKTG